MIKKERFTKRPFSVKTHNIKFIMNPSKFHFKFSKISLWIFQNSITNSSKFHYESFKKHYKFIKVPL